MNSFFKDLKIVELANVLAGPATATFFAELGAEVIKIENKTNNGDVTRSWKLSSEKKENTLSAYYASANTNKTSVFLDLTHESDKEKVYELVKTADIVISNYKPGDDLKLGMDYETLKKINPTLIYAHITGFGETSGRTAYDLVLQAETGFMYLNGTQESGPLKMPVALIDIIAAHHLKEAILVALIHKLKNAEGSKVSVSLYDAAVASLANQAGNWLMAGIDPQPIGSLHPNIAPYGELFETKDGKKIVLAVGNDKQFMALCRLLKCEELSQNQKFISNTDRVKNRSELFISLEPAFKNRDSKELMDRFMEKDIPAGLIKSIKDVFEEKEAKNLILTENKEGQATKKVKTAIFKSTR